MFKKSPTLVLFMLCSAMSIAQTVTNVRATFTDCTAEIRFDLSTSTPIDLTLWYSGDGGTTWQLCNTVSGALLAQTSGTNKLITWDNQADNVLYGRFAFKVEVPTSTVECVMIAGVCWATHNLSAHGEFVDNPQDYGALFQWGRRGDGHEQRNSPTISTQASGANLDANGQAAGTHEGRFITGYSNWRSQHDSLWCLADGTKTVNDPCPPGWRVPTYTELNALASLPTSQRVWTTNWNGTGVSGREFGEAPNTIFLPAAGNRYYSDGSLYLVGADGGYWSSSVIGAFAWYLYFYSGFVGMNYDYRADGFSVRCVSE